MSFINSPSDNKSEIPRLKILMVDDSQENIFLLSAFLKKLPFAIETASNGQEAVEIFKTRTIDLILMDIQMPIKDGYTAIKEIRSLESQNRLSRIPIIAVTANAMSEDRMRCINAGATDYLSKPVRKSDLILMIEKYTMKGELKTMANELRTLL